jgi:pilus assembly protein Flp/PilA
MTLIADAFAVCFVKLANSLCELLHFMIMILILVCDLNMMLSLFNFRHKKQGQKMTMRVWDYLRDYLKDESGATAIEYGILAAGLAAGILAIFGSDGIFITALKEKFTAIVAGLNMDAAGK